MTDKISPDDQEVSQYRRVKRELPFVVARETFPLQYAKEVVRSVISRSKENDLHVADTTWPQLALACTAFLLVRGTQRHQGPTADKDNEPYRKRVEQIARCAREIGEAVDDIFNQACAPLNYGGEIDPGRRLTLEKLNHALHLSRIPDSLRDQVREATKLKVEMSRLIPGGNWGQHGLEAITRVFNVATEIGRELRGPSEYSGAKSVGARVEQDRCDFIQDIALTYANLTKDRGYRASAGDPASDGPPNPLGRYIVATFGILTNKEFPAGSLRVFDLPDYRTINRYLKRLREPEGES